MSGARTAAALGAAVMCIGLAGCAGASTEAADTARQESAAMRVEARAGGTSAADTQGARLAELADALAGGGAAESQGDRLAAYAAAADGDVAEVSAAAAHQGVRLSAYAEAWAVSAE